MKCIFSAVILVSLLGCATSKDAPTFSVAPSPDNEQNLAVLYIFRDYAEPIAFSSYLKIDGTKVVSLKQQGYSWIYVKPGEKEVKFGWPIIAGMPSVSFKFNFEKGNSYAFQMGGISRMAGFGNIQIFNTHSDIIPIGIDEAKKKMSECCRYVNPKIRSVE